MIIASSLLSQGVEVRKAGQPSYPIHLVNTNIHAVCHEQIEEDGHHNLWPYAMRHANDIANTTPRKGKELSPLELFSGVQIAPKLSHFHAFGCPTYMLDNMLQSGQGAPKWKERSRLGVYLSLSPNHAHSIALVLNPRAGHVSPQFHIKFDNFFEMVQDKSTDLNAPDPEWKYLSSFATKKGPAKIGAKGGLGGLLALRQGATAATTTPQESTVTEFQSKRTLSNSNPNG